MFIICLCIYVKARLLVCYNYKAPVCYESYTDRFLAMHARYHLHTTCTILLASLCVPSLTISRRSAEYTQGYGAVVPLQMRMPPPSKLIRAGSVLLHRPTGFVRAAVHDHPVGLVPETGHLVPASRQQQEHVRATTEAQSQVPPTPGTAVLGCSGPSEQTCWA